MGQARFLQRISKTMRSTYMNWSSNLKPCHKEWFQQKKRNIIAALFKTVNLETSKLRNPPNDGKFNDLGPVRRN